MPGGVLGGWVLGGLKEAFRIAQGWAAQNLMPCTFCPEGLKAAGQQGE